MSEAYYQAVGVFLRFHSDYMGYKIYRQVDVLSGTPRMSYFAIVWEDPEHIDNIKSKAKDTLHAKNLASIKALVKEKVKG